MLVTAGSAQAAGFDCTKAAAHVEKLICGDQTLSVLDSRMADAYKAALTLGDPPAADITKRQKSWLSSRSYCIHPETSDTDIVGCLTAQYRQQIDYLANPKICRIDRLNDCSDTNQLIWSGGEKAVRAFLGPGKSTDELIGLIGGPPEDIVTLPNGWKLAGACRAHDCDSKGAAFLTASGEVLAFAALTYRSASDYGLTLYLRKDADRPAITEIAQGWAEPNRPSAGFGETQIETVSTR